MLLSGVFVNCFSYIIKSLVLLDRVQLKFKALKYKFLLILVLSLNLFWALDQPAMAEDVLLSESVLKTMIESNPPEIQRIEASFLELKKNHFAAKDELALRLDGDAEVYKSSERSLPPADFFTRSASQYNVGLVKPTAYGVDVSLKTFAQKSTNLFLAGATITGVTVGLSVDLFQNFLGRKTKTSLKQTAAGLKRAGLEKKSGLKTFESNLRKIYWSLVATQEQKTLVESLIKTAEQQLKDAEARRRLGVTDQGEAARFKSQLSTRKSNLLSLNYQESEYLKALRELIPELEGKKISLSPYNVENTIQRVFECINVIKNDIETPFKYTPYDEIVQLMIEEEKYEQKILNTYNDPTIKLVGELSSVGKDFSYDESRQDFIDNSRDRSRLALTLSVPLDGSKSKTQEIAKLAAKNKYISMAENNLARVKAFHLETIRIIDTLHAILMSQKETSKYLGISLGVSQKKFNQGRISLQELISEQDSHIQNKLNEIDSNLTIVKTLIDYFSIYNDTPCDFNRI